MNRRWSLAILALAPLALSASAFAEGGRLAGNLLPGLGERAAAILDATRAMATLPPGTGALMFYDPATDVAGAADAGAYAAGDRAWVEAALAVYDLHRQLGGVRPERRQLFRRDGAGFFVGTDGGAGAWFDSADAALAGYFAQLGLTGGPRPRLVREAALASRHVGMAGLLDALAARAGPRADLVVLAPGGHATVELPGAAFAAGSPGIEVTAEPGPAGVVATVTATTGASATAAVYGYGDGQRFAPSRTVEVAVDRTAAIAAQAGHAVTAPAAPHAVALVDRIDGRIGATGDVAVYTLDVAKGGTYSIASDGPSDVAAVLVDAEGNPVAADDDGGGGYNFRIDGDLAAGGYRLEVRHCCGGTGPFQVTVRPAR